MNLRRHPASAWALTWLGLLALIAWEASGADRTVTHLLADANGFALRDNWWLAEVLHSGGRWLAWGLLALMAVDALKPFDGGPAAGRPSPARRERWQWLAVVLAAAVAVPGLKRFSSTSCPWDLAEYGGADAAVHYVPHWLLGVVDGGSGHCFPSGHAAGVLAFTAVYFLWLPYRPRIARRLLAAVWMLGAVYGTVQVLRGAHFVSHVLWAAWLCWVIGLSSCMALSASALFFKRRTSPQQPAAPAA
jgi:membrane-associated PAP2 superfamily phosphatase